MSRLNKMIKQLVREAIVKRHGRVAETTMWGDYSFDLEIGTPRADDEESADKIQAEIEQILVQINSVAKSHPGFEIKITPVG